MVRQPPGAQQAGSNGAAASAKQQQQDSTDEEEEEDAHAEWTPERRVAEGLVAALVQQWRKPIDTLSKAGKAFEVRAVPL